MVKNSVISFLLSVFRFKFAGFQSIGKLINRELVDFYPTTENREPKTDELNKNV